MIKRQYLIPGIITVSLFVCSVVFYAVAHATDSQLALVMNADMGSTLNTIMIAASSYGREYFWAGVLTLMLVFGKKETRLIAVELAILFTIGLFAEEALKHLIYVPRPFETMSGIVARVPINYDSSFPSGHALIVTIGATFVLLKFKRKKLALALTFEAAIVAYSRVYVGMHYPLDVAAGILLGSVIVFLWMAFFDEYFGSVVMRFYSSASNSLRNHSATFELPLHSP
jgi:undecaprenyl-diphosphatase